MGFGARAPLCDLKTDAFKVGTTVLRYHSQGHSAYGTTNPQFLHSIGSEESRTGGEGAKGMIGCVIGYWGRSVERADAKTQNRIHTEITESHFEFELRRGNFERGQSADRGMTKKGGGGGRRKEEQKD